MITSRTELRDAPGRPPDDDAFGSAEAIRVLHIHSSQGLYGPERWTHLVLRSTRSRRVQFRVLTLGDKPGYDDFARFLVRQGFAASHLPISSKLSRSAVMGIRDHVVQVRRARISRHARLADASGEHTAWLV